MIIKIYSSQDHVTVEKTVGLWGLVGRVEEVEKGLHTVLGRVTLCLSKLIERGSSKSEPPDAQGSRVS